MTQLAEDRIQANYLKSRFPRMVVAWTAILLLQVLDLLLLTSRNDDQSWYLYAAQRVLSGAQISGPQLVETNPPLILWFSTLPAFLANLLHLDPYLTLKVIVFVMIGLSVAWSGRILRIIGVATSQALLYVSAASVLSAEIFLSRFELGQREHFVVILLVPYILSATFKGSSKLHISELCAIGLAAGMAVCFKPQQVLVLIALELFLAVWNRSLRRITSPDLICAILTIFAYIALVRLAAPLFFSTTLPILRATYWAYGPYSAWLLIKAEPQFNILFIVTLAATLLLRRKLHFAIVPSAFLACTVASSIVYYSQHIKYTGNYRAYPQGAFLLLAILWILIDFAAPSLEHWKLRSTFVVGSLIFALALLVLLVLRVSLRKPLSRPANTPFVNAVFAQYPPQTPVFIFSGDVSDAFPAVSEDHLVWASRFAHLWMLPAIVQNEAAEAGSPPPGKVLAPADVTRLADLQRAETTEDFERWRPTVVIVKKCSESTPCYGMGNMTFDPLTWFLKSPEFGAEWAHYRLQKSHDNYDVYTRLR